MEERTARKNKLIAIRVTQQENKLFGMLAEGQGISISEFLRTAGLTIAEMSVDNKELLKSLGRDETQAYQNIKNLLEIMKETLLNSIKGSNTSILRRLDNIEKLVDISLYAYLFHTPEVKETMKQQARKSALTRKGKLLSFINDSST